MKKVISLISIFAIILTFFLTGATYAASLDSLSVNVDKTTVRPGQTVKLTINFGVVLGAYTFDIAYDNNIFDFVSVDGGAENNTGDKVRVTFYDANNGRDNMSIVFKAKEGITTSNPTELTVTGEGLANQDASITYDDIVTPIVKNITVEPEYQDYVLKLEHTGDIIVNKEKEMKLSYSSSMGHYYEHARLIAEATTPEGGNVKLTAIDTTANATEDIIQSGWGNPQGYKIGGKDFSQVLNVQALFTKAGNYTITLKLIDRDSSDSVIAQEQFSFIATEETTEIVPPPEEPETPPTTETPETPETPPETSDKPGQTETPEEPTKQPTTNNQQTTTQQKPTTLPKTGENIYVPIAVLLIGLTSVIVYYNKKK